MHGILPLWKPKGMTSHDCVMKIRKLFGTKKVGHTGTLDPEVEGVLTICIGNATKVVSYLTAMKKTYIAECCLGVATETEDAYGAVIEEMEVNHPPTNEKIRETLTSFLGTITQIPPMYSAVKVKGKKLYEYARANEKVERPSRQVTIYEIEMVPNQSPALNKFSFKVVCSQGTYIRTLCVDIGNELGYPAHMSHLVRTEAGSFNKEDTVTFSDIENAIKDNKEKDLLLPISRGLIDLDRYYIDENLKKRVLYGQKLKKPVQELKTNPFIMMHEEQLLAIYEVHPENSNEIKPIRVFNE